MNNILLIIWHGVLFFLKWYTIFFAVVAALSLSLAFFDKRLKRAPIMVALWWGFGLIKITTMLSGFVVGPILYFYRLQPYDSLPFWTRPYANPEDWLGQQNHYKDGLPKWWYLEEGTGFKSWYRYNVIRNPANGLRSFELLDLDIVPEQVNFIRSKNFSKVRYDIPAIRDAEGDTVWYFAWQGLQAGCKVVHIWSDKKHLDIKFGWRVEPSDQDPLYHHGIGSNDASFASKFLFNRDG